MKEQEKTQRYELKKIVVPLISFAGMGVLGYLAGSLIGASDIPLKAPGDLNVFTAVLTALLALYLVLLTHELGHLLFGKLAGMKPFLLITGPLKAVATQNGWQVSLNTNINLAGGLAACMPVNTESLRRDLLWLVAGGPIASLLGGVAGALLYIFMPGDSLLSFFGLFFGITAAAIFLVTLVPAKTSGFMTDGAQIISLLKGGIDVEQRALLLVLQAESLKGVRPRDYPYDILQRLLVLRCSPMMDSSADLFAYYYHLDRGDVMQAGQSLGRVLDQQKALPEGLKQAVYLEAAFFQAACEKRAGSAREYLRQSRGALADKHTFLRSEAAVLFVEGDRDQAHDKAMQARTLFAKAFDAGSAAAESDWLERYLDWNGKETKQ